MFQHRLAWGSRLGSVFQCPYGHEDVSNEARRIVRSFTIPEIVSMPLRA